MIAHIYQGSGGRRKTQDIMYRISAWEDSASKVTKTTLPSFINWIMVKQKPESFEMPEAVRIVAETACRVACEEAEVVVDKIKVAKKIVRSLVRPDSKSPFKIIFYEDLLKPDNKCLTLNDSVKAFLRPKVNELLQKTDDKSYYRGLLEKLR